MCVGGSDSVNDPFTLRVVACANCLSVTTQTSLNQPMFYGAAYWYFTDGQSFGFSPTNTINQYNADSTDLNSNLRVSWHLLGNVGGWRLGNITNLNDDLNYYKKIFINTPFTTTTTLRPTTTTTTASSSESLYFSFAFYFIY